MISAVINVMVDFLFWILVFLIPVKNTRVANSLLTGFFLISMFVSLVSFGRPL